MTGQNESPDAPTKKIRWDIIAVLYSVAGLLFLVSCNTTAHDGRLPYDSAYDSAYERSLLDDRLGSPISHMSLEDLLALDQSENTEQGSGQQPPVHPESKPE